MLSLCFLNKCKAKTGHLLCDFVVCDWGNNIHINWLVCDRYEMIDMSTVRHDLNL